MAQRGWKQLLANHTWFRGKGKYPITAYSEFMPPPRLGCKPYGSVDPLVLREDDPCGWQITEYEQAAQLNPGLTQIARELVTALHHLGRGEPAHGISRHKLQDNPYWPEQTLAPASERYVVLAPLALSRTQDDKGRIRWTLFGASEQGPAKGFWRGFYTAPGEEWPVERSLDFIRRLLAAAYGESPEHLADLGRAGFRILPEQSKPTFAHWRVDDLPKWTKPFLWQPRQKVADVKYLLTFEPFERLSPAIRKAYLAGELHLLPFPGSLVFWGSAFYNRLTAAAAACRPNRATALDFAARGPLGYSRPSVGLDARADGAASVGRQALGRTSARAGPQHVPAHAPLEPRASLRGRVGDDDRRRPRGARLVQHPGRRLGPVWQADGSQLTGLDSRFPAAARRAPGARPRSDRGGRSRASRRIVRLSLHLSGRCASAGMPCSGSGRWWPSSRDRPTCRPFCPTRRWAT